MAQDHDMLLWLTRQIAATAELLGHEIKPMAASMLAEDLAGYGRAALAAALQRVRAEHSGKLTAKAVIERIDESLGRPAANEAWAVAVQALDERATVVWTDEMAQAWDAARAIAAGGDMVGGRMAFIAAYERLVRAARDARLVPQVSVSMGWDASARQVAVDKAVALGYLTPEAAQRLLPAPAQSRVFSPAALLQGRVEPAGEMPPEIRRKFESMRRELAARAREKAQAQAQEARRARQDWQERKRTAQARAQEFLQQTPRGAA